MFIFKSIMMCAKLIIYHLPTEVHCVGFKKPNMALFI